MLIIEFLLDKESLNQFNTLPIVFKGETENNSVVADEVIFLVELEVVEVKL